jgi:N-acetylglucosaminyl-diphospho-decaprenol L-rhamnosyltransferase
MAIDLSVVIISLNSKTFLDGCLESFAHAEWRRCTHEIIVVDNGSVDGTLEMLERDHPTVKVIANPSNVGYCKAGNQGAQAALGRYILFLNDDTLVVGDAMPLLIEWADAHSMVGMIGSRLLNADGTDQFSSGRRFTTPAAAIFGRKSLLTRVLPRARWAQSYLMSDQIDSTEPYEVDWLSAAAMVVSRDAYNAAGGLAEDFYYFHEQVFCARVKRAGYGIFLHPRSKIVHFEGVGSGHRTRRVRCRHIRAFHQAALRWFCLHHGIGQYHPARLFAAVLLYGRAGLLMSLEWLRGDPRMELSHLDAGRPEGGVAV